MLSGLTFDCAALCANLVNFGPVTPEITILEQEAFEKCWAHSPLRTATLPFTICRYCCTPPAHGCPQRRRRRRQQRQRQRVTEGTAMAP